MIAGRQQLFCLGQFHGELPPDLIDQIQRLVPLQHTLVGRKGHVLCFIDHLKQHVQQFIDPGRHHRFLLLFIFSFTSPMISRGTKSLSSAP